MRYAVYIARFSALCSVMLLLLHLWVRQYFDLDTAISPLVKITIITLAITNAPFLIPTRLLPWLSIRPHWLPFSTLIILLLPLLAWHFGPISFWLFPPLAAIGIANSLRIRPFTRRETTFLLIIALLHSLHYFLWSNGSFEINPNSTPNHLLITYFPISLMHETAFTGTLYRDFWSHFSIIHMLSSWGHASTGLDGFFPMAYHMGGHVWFASLCRMLGEEPFDTAPPAFLLLWFPCLTFAFLFSGLCLHRRLRSSPLFYLTASISLWWLYNIAANFIGFFMSVTFTPALTLLLLCFPLILTEIRLLLTRQAPFIKPSIFLALMALPITLCKMQAGAMLIALGGYAFLRRFITWPWLIFGLTPLGFLPLLFLARLQLGQMDNNIYDTANLLSWLFNAINWLLFAIPAFLPAALYLALYRPGKRLPFLPPSLPLPQARLWASQELLYAASALGLWFMMFIGNEYWFPYTVSWMALTLIIGHPFFESALLAPAKTRLLHFKNAFSGQTEGNEHPLEKIIVIFTIILTAQGIGTIINYDFIRLPQTIRWMKTQLSHRPDLLERTTAYINTLPMPSNTLTIFIPPENPLWQLGNDYLSRAFYIPSLTGIPLLKGLPQPDPACLYDCKRFGYGYDAYPADATTSAQTDEALCKRSLARGFTHVLRLENMQNLSANKLVTCEAQP